MWRAMLQKIFKPTYSGKRVQVVVESAGFSPNTARIDAKRRVQLKDVMMADNYSPFSDSVTMTYRGSYLSAREGREP
jgi:hypothetical protein